MKLLTKEVLKKLKPDRHYAEHEGDIPITVKFFTPDSNWTWYPYEFDGKDTFSGLVDGFEMELGSFSLSELESARGPLGLPIERDLHFTPTTLHKIREEKWTSLQR